MAAFLALLIGTAWLAVGTAPAASAAPGDRGDDGEGGSRTLLQQLDAAARGYFEAGEALERSKKRQRELTDLVRRLDADLGSRRAEVDVIARQSYRAGRLAPMNAL